MIRHYSGLDDDEPHYVDPGARFDYLLVALGKLQCMPTANNDDYNYALPLRARAHERSGYIGYR